MGRYSRRRRRSDGAPTKIIYNGEAEGRSWDVFVGSGHSRQKLPPRLDVRNHSPTGFAWGYGGSGPAQLALALLLYEYGDEELERVERIYQLFKFRVIDRLPQDEDWKLTSDQIREIVDELEGEREGALA